MQPKSWRGGLSRRQFLAVSAAGAVALGADAQKLAGLQTLEAAQHDLAFPGETHDLPGLAPWGPYSKKFYGISHLPDIASGLLFDLSIFPLLAGAEAKLPNVTDCCGVHPWEASADLRFYSTRTEMLWRNQVYCDTAYIDYGSRSRLIRIELVNRTAEPQTVTLHGLTQLCFPPLHELTAEPIQLCDVTLPASGLWVDALDYETMKYAVSRPTDNLVQDGRWRGEERMNGSVGGSVLAQGFGRDAGDTVLYQFNAPHGLKDAVLVFRYRCAQGQNVNLRCGGLSDRVVTFAGTGDFALVTLRVGAMATGAHVLRLTSEGGAALALNGFAVTERDDAASVAFPAKPWHPKPQIVNGPNASLLLKYADVSNWYGFTMDEDASAPALVEWRDLDRTFQARSGDATQARIFGQGHGRPGDPDSLFVHQAWKPLLLGPSSSRVLYGLLATGTQESVEAAMRSFNPASPSHELAFQQARQRAAVPQGNAAGEPFLQGQRLLAATTLSNVVYPLRTQKQTIRNYSPGKIWDCLYTWDAGFIGLGLLELDIDAAIACLNAYLTPPDSQSAFVHHGTPLPTQIYLFLEIWNRTQSRRFLRHFYPRLRQYYLFLAGRFGSSTTRPHRNNLICTWDYFYNTGGWDDYPPQVYVHKQKIEASTAPAVSTAHVIRSAKMLRMVARELGMLKDIAGYDADIAAMAVSLDRDAWDPASGYFGYVRYDASGAPAGILRTQQGVNFNLGLDGVSPLIAGICTPQQEAAILKNLFSKDHLWTEAGITTVDQQAPYYNPNGYWNGSVWFAHQWFLFKTMLDLGRGDFAVQIARTGVDTWQKATEASFGCMEHFSSQPPYGAGWCEFSSLCSPALSWFAALYTPGRLTAGFDAWISAANYDAQDNVLRASFDWRSPQTRNGAEMLLCLRPAAQYDIRWDGQRVAATEVLPGLLRLPMLSNAHNLVARGL